MPSSPFHGIFAAMQQESSSKMQKDNASMLTLMESASTQEDVRKEQSSMQSAGQLAVDIYEQDNYVIIRAPVAGVKLPDIDIEVDGKVITIRGKRTDSVDIPEGQYYVKECFWGEFSRSVTLPTHIDAKKVKATFSRDGILKILIPKEERVKVVRINEGS